MNILYLTRTGLLEPLGQSQVFSYMRGLSTDHQITVLSFERPHDLADAAAVQRLRDQCSDLGIRWVCEQYHSYPRILAPMRDLVRAARLARREALAASTDVIHARSLIPALVAFATGWRTGAPFIFDMRGFWPEELITSGRLQRGSLLHRMLAGLERMCLRRAAHVVVLTEAAAAHVAGMQLPGWKAARCSVIPTCVDLDRFAKSPLPQKPVIHGCIGSITTGWFRADWLAASFAAQLRANPEAQFEVLTRDDPVAVRSLFKGYPEVTARLTVNSVTSSAMPTSLARHQTSAFFYQAGRVSELGRSPTRLAEILACGRPVLVNAGVGDVENIVRRHRVGVIAEGPSDAAMDLAVKQLDLLLSDPGLSDRCHEAAAAVFSLRSGTLAYDHIYRSVERVPDHRRSPAEAAKAKS